MPAIFKQSFKNADYKPILKIKNSLYQPLLRTIQSLSIQSRVHSV